MSPGFNFFFCSGTSKIANVGDVGGHEIHIFTANIPTLHVRYRREVAITNEFHEFC
jgi:hypothetical protein